MSLQQVVAFEAVAVEYISFSFRKGYQINSTPERGKKRTTIQILKSVPARKAFSHLSLS